MKKPFLYIVLALFFTAILILYNNLGGFNEPVIMYEHITEYVFMGKNYEGKTSDPTIEDLFTEMKQLKLEDQYKGSLVMVWFEEAKTKNDIVHVFIGLEKLPGENIPDHLETTTIQMNGLVRAKINAHASVMPSPSKVQKMIKAYAEKNNYTLQDILIDKYPEESVVYTEIPVRVNDN